MLGTLHGPFFGVFMAGMLCGWSGIEYRTVRPGQCCWDRHGFKGNTTGCWADASVTVPTYCTQRLCGAVCDVWLAETHRCSGVNKIRPGANGHDGSLCTSQADIWWFAALQW